MQCPACGATCAPGVTTACDTCGQALDLEMTGFTPAPPVTTIGDTGATRLSAPDATRLSAPDATRLSAPDATRLSAPGAARHERRGPLEIGESFGGRYHIIKLLGMGGMGAVYQTWDSELEVALALKVIRPDATSDPAAAAEIERRFKRELLLARQVTHPNVVRIHDLGEIDGIKYITMPCVQGTDLADVLSQKKTLPVPEALYIASQIALGLLAAHSAGVVHRDLKPANIMIDAKRNALITDFGIARASSTTEAPAAASAIARGAVAAAKGDGDETRVGTIIGSIDYMAPEQARGLHVDHRADIYAFGLILYRMLVGRQMSAGATDAWSDLQARMTAEPRPLREIDPKLPVALEKVVSRCLQPDPAGRFQSTQELVAALQRLDENGNPLPLPVQLLKSVRFWGAAAVVAATIAVGTWFVAHRPPPTAHAPVAVLIADFVNHTGEPVFDGLMEQSVTVGIEAASFITAVPRGPAARTARLIKAGDRLDESASRLVALREGIKIVLLGGIEKNGSGYRLSVQGIDPSSRKVLFASTADARNRDAVLAAGGTLAARVRSALGDTRAVDPKETLSTASLEAANAYTRAQELSAAGKDSQAIESFRKAVSLDPGFGRAYGGLAMSATRLGRRDEAAALWKEALKHLDVMSEREQYRLLGAYYTSVTRNFEAARDTYEKLVKQYPADGAGHNNLAVMDFHTLQFDKTLAEGRLVLQVYPNSPLYRTNFALYAMYAGDFALASKEARQVVQDNVANYDSYLPLAISAIAAGKPKEARDAYTRMATVDDSGASLASTGLADLLLAEGRPAEAMAILQTGIAADERQQNPAGVAVKEIALADAFGMQGDVKRAVDHARRALAIANTESQVLPAVRWLIAANHVDEAARLGQQLDASLEAQPRAYGRVVAAQVAHARGRQVEAVDALRDALKLADLWLVRFNLGQAYLDAGAPTEALSQFEACLKRRGEGFAVFLDDIPTARAVAPVRYWMGRAHEAMGLMDQARGDYQGFISAYASDSPEPLLKDARARLVSLP
jgi:serine/threonine protein kinase/tetratricopeptide (TPR) repeat protein